jgi:hypothetical protein
MRSSTLFPICKNNPFPKNFVSLVIIHKISKSNKISNQAKYILTFSRKYPSSESIVAKNISSGA